MKSITKQNRGMTELLIILPLFLGMICVVAWIGFLLVAKSKMEKHAWMIQTKQSYKMDVDASQLNPAYELEENISMRQFVQIGSMFRGTLPRAFQAYLVSKVTKYKTLKLDGESPEVIAHTYNAGFETPLGNRNPDESIPNILPFSFEADLIVANTGMEGLEIVKNDLYGQALTTAGFEENYNFRRLGFKELNDAKVPFAQIAELVANWDLPGDYLDEVKRWME